MIDMKTFAELTKKHGRVEDLLLADKFTDEIRLEFEAAGLTEGILKGIRDDVRLTARSRAVKSLATNLYLTLSHVQRKRKKPPNKLQLASIEGEVNWVRMLRNGTGHADMEKFGIDYKELVREIYARPERYPEWDDLIFYED